MSSDKIYRLSTIIKLIANNPGITLTQLQKRLPEFGVSITERTLAKDIVTLKSEFKLLPDKDRLRKGYVLEDIYTLSHDELEIVLDALHLLSARMDDVEAQDVMERLVGLLNRDQNQSARPRVRTVRQRSILKRDKQYKEKIGVLHEAIRRRAAVSFVYHTPRVGKDQNLTGYPLLMVFYERGWYCIMRHINSTTYRPRRIDRIKQIRILDGAPLNENAQDNVREANYLLNCGWGMTFPKNIAEVESADRAPSVVARFDRTIAPYILEAVERHPKGKIVSVTDGTGDVEFGIKLADPREFIQWIRSFGSKARLVEPLSLVEQERAEVRRMAERYSSTLDAKPKQ